MTEPTCPPHRFQPRSLRWLRRKDDRLICVDCGFVTRHWSRWDSARWWQTADVATDRDTEPWMLPKEPLDKGTVVGQGKLPRVPPPKRPTPNRSDTGPRSLP